MGEKGGRMKMNSLQKQEQLIPCIPDEIATECLVRIPYRFHSTLKLVSHGWRSLLSDSSFYSNRRELGLADHLIFLVQPLPVTNSEPEASDKAEMERRINGPPAYSLGVFNLTRNEWHRLDGKLRIPMFCQVVAIPSSGKVVLLGGWDPDTLEAVDSVYMIDLISGAWKRGAPMPTARSFFAVSASACGGRVYVAGGHDGQKNALRSAEVYDLGGDGWASLPAMEEERDECLGMEWKGGLMVVSGYGTNSQGRFREDAEWFDEDSGRWCKVEGVWPFEAVSPRSTAVGGERWWWMTESGEAREFDWVEMRWKVKMMPEGGSASGSGSGSVCVVDLGKEEGGGFFVMGKEAYVVVDMEGTRVWNNLHTPPAFLGLPFSTCHLRI